MIALLGVTMLFLFGSAVTASADGLRGSAVTASANVLPPGAEAPCREPVAPVQASGRWIHLWLCDNGWHGQITNGAAGDWIWMRSAAGTDSGHARIAPGQTAADSGTVGQFGGPWRACGGPDGVTVCTAPN